jgi:hypothetical protein
MLRGLRTRTVKGPRRIAALWNARSDPRSPGGDPYGSCRNKWKHYFEIYDRHFAGYRNSAATILEIGVAAGGSLDLWRRYFGTKARIIGLDINPDCKRFERDGTLIRIGSQNDPAFLERLSAELGPFDIVIDDGSHRFEHQLTAFRALFHHIRADGIYSCEDVCTSYWEPEFGGGVRKPGTFIEFAKELVDELNAWFWRDGVEGEADAFARSAYGMHFYPALLVIEKRRMTAPVLAPVGLRHKA